MLAVAGHIGDQRGPAMRHRLCVGFRKSAGIEAECFGPLSKRQRVTLKDDGTSMDRYAGFSLGCHIVLLIIDSSARNMCCDGAMHCYAHTVHSALVSLVACDSTMGGMSSC